MGSEKWEKLYNLVNVDLKGAFEVQVDFTPEFTNERIIIQTLPYVLFVASQSHFHTKC